MLITITVILLIVWILGLVGVFSIGAWIHLFLVAAIILFIAHLMRGNKNKPMM